VCGALTFGKKMPEDYYIHRSAEQRLPPLLRLLLFAARQVVGKTDYNIVKLSLDGRKVSFLQYREFDDLAHPELSALLQLLGVIINASIMGKQ